MRLTHVALRNYRAFLDAEIDLSPATAFVGPNDSGKSTILDAVRSLFEDYSSDGLRYDWNVVRAFPAIANDWIEDTSVAGILGELTSDEVQAWSPILIGGELHIGAHFPASFAWESTPGLRYLILNADVANGLLVPRDSGGPILGRLDEVNRTLASIEGVDPAPAGRWRHVGDKLWIPWTDWISMFGRLGSHLIEWHVKDEVAATLPREFPGVQRLVHIRGLEHPIDDLKVLIKPVLRRFLERNLADELIRFREEWTTLRHAAADLFGAMGRKYGQALRGYGEFAEDAHFRPVMAPASFDPVEQLIEGLYVDLLRSSDPKDAGFASFSARELGAGAQRLAALAAVELYADPDLWGTGEWAIVLMEEPEAGLYPKNEQRLATALRSLSRFGTQVLITSHSPAMVNAVPVEGIRMVTSDRRIIERDGERLDMRDHHIRKPTDVDAVRRVLGASPSDILLAKKYVLVEGVTDAAILAQWSLSNGVDLSAAGVKLIPVSGTGHVRQIVTVLLSMREDTELVVILDGGSNTAKIARELEASYDRIRVHLLRKSEIEAYFHPAAVARWAEAIAADNVNEEAIVAALNQPVVKRALSQLVVEWRGRAYIGVEDGAAIAAHTREHEIDPEIRGILTELAL